jgi:hypothetical protein
MTTHGSVRRVHFGAILCRAAPNQTFATDDSPPLTCGFALRPTWPAPLAPAHNPSVVGSSPTRPTRARIKQGTSTGIPYSAPTGKDCATVRRLAQTPVRPVEALTVDDLALLLPDWRAHLRARNAAPSIVLSYLKVGANLLDYLRAQGMPTSTTGIQANASRRSSPTESRALSPSGDRAGAGLYPLALVAIVVGVDIVFFGHQFWERLTGSQRRHRVGVRGLLLQVPKTPVSAVGQEGPTPEPTRSRSGSGRRYRAVSNAVVCLVDGRSHRFRPLGDGSWFIH